MADADTIHRIEERIVVTGADEAEKVVDNVADKFELAADKVAMFEQMIADALETISTEAPQQTQKVNLLQQRFKDAATKAEEYRTRVKELGEVGLDRKLDPWVQSLRMLAREPPTALSRFEGFVNGLDRKVSGFAGTVKQAFGGTMVGAIFKGNLAAMALTKGLGFAINKVRAFERRFEMVNKQMEAAQGRVQGLTLGLVDFKGVEPGQQIATSLKFANVALEEFRDIGLKAATPVPQIESAWARIAPVILGLGKSQKEVMDLTERSATAAKIYGERAEMAGSIVAKAVFEGTVEGETAFARAFKAQAQVTSKMKVEDRLKKIIKVLDKMGAPIKEVTKSTEDAQLRWQILTDDVLQRATYPIYRKIGEVSSDIVQYALDHEDAIDKAVDYAGELMENIFSIGDGVWDVSVALYDWLGVSEKVTWLWGMGVDTVKGIFVGVDAIGSAFKVVADGIDILNNGFDKSNHTAEKFSLEIDSWELKVMKVVKAVGQLTSAMSPEWLQKASEWIGFKDTWKDFEKGLDMQEELIAKQEKALGVSPTTEIGRRMAREEAGIGLSKTAKEALLKGLKGLKIQQNIGTVNVRQDFRDQDPDRVLVEFSNMLTRLGENPVQSTVGGAGTLYGPAGAA